MIDRATPYQNMSRRRIFLSSESTRRALVFLLILAATSAGCARNRTQAPDPFTFATRITDGGLKQFEVTFPYAPRQLVLTQRGSTTHGRKRNDANRLTQRRMEQVVATKVSAAGYCRQGYLLLGTQAGNTVQKVRGECRDPATLEDRSLFPDTIKRW